MLAGFSPSPSGLMAAISDGAKRRRWLGRVRKLEIDERGTESGDKNTGRKKSKEAFNGSAVVNPTQWPS